MSTSVKVFLIRFLVNGLIFALLWWGWDVAEGKAFDPRKFLFRLVLFGFLIALSGMILSRRSGHGKGRFNKEPTL